MLQCFAGGLAKTDMQRADIADESAITQIGIEREKNHKMAQLQLESGKLSEVQKKIINDQLEAQDVLLDAKLTQIVKDGEKRRLEYKLEIAKRYLIPKQIKENGITSDQIEFNDP